MVRKRYAKDPLFYIQQPKMKKPEVKMQDHYATPKKTAKSAPEQHETNTSSVMPTRGNSFQQFQNPQPAVIDEDDEDSLTETWQEHQEEQEDTTEGEQNSQKNRERTKFKDMTVEEKIDYFLNLPSHIPNLKCEVKTEERSYRGIIIDQEEETIILRTGRRNFSIPIEEIIDIRMLGM